MTADADFPVWRECSAGCQQRFMLPGLAPPPALDASIGHGGEQIVVARHQLTQLCLAEKAAVTISGQHLPVPPCQNGLQLRQQRNIPDSGACLGGAQLRNGAIVLYALAAAPVSPEFRISYFVGDPESAKNELLGKGVTDAITKAGALVKAAGVTLGEILSIDYSWGQISNVCIS